ncbi:MAG: VWA domain-containing protein [Anaerolineae bacterium]|nr:VWA domain-containing protein [Anaerolineae bacterium]
MRSVRTTSYALLRRRSMLLVILVALALTVWGMPSQAQDAGIGPITIRLESIARQGDPQTGFPVNDDGQDHFLVTITLQGGECPAVPREIPVDAVLVIDTSSSMDEDTPENISKLDATKQAALTFIRQFNFVPGSSASDQIAIVSFNSDADMEVDLTSDQTVLENAINDLRTSGSTNIADGLTLATDILASASANYQGDAHPVIVLLSDGEDSDTSAVRREAERARQLTGASIITVGLGDPADVDEDTLRDIADSPDDAYLATSASELTILYEQIAREIQPQIVANNLVITYTVNTEIFQIVPGTSVPNAALNGPATAPNVLQWTVDQVNSGEDVELQTELRGLMAISNATVGTVAVEYFPCGQVVPAAATEIGPIVTILQPTATPTPTHTPTPTPSPTPTASPTATPNAVLRDPGPTETIGRTTDLGLDFCAPGWWDWLPWIVVIIVALIGVYLLWRALNNLLSKKHKTIWDWLCWLLRLLFLILLLILLFLLLQPVAGVLCDVPESVYFWRMDGSQRGIFLTHSDLAADEPAQVSSLNETASCLGCHFVSSEAEIVGAIVGPVPDNDALRLTEFDGDLIEDLPPIDAIYGAFSPDGRKLAVTTSNAELFVFDRDAPAYGWQQFQNASDAQNGVLMPAWTPDGQNIAFVRANRGNLEVGLLALNQSDIYMIASDPALNAVPIPIVGASANDGLNYYPAFSPDGRWLAFTHHQNATTYSDPQAEIWLLNLETGVAGPIAGNAPNASNSWPSWNRNGTKLAFNTTAYDPNFDIVVVDVYADGTTSTAYKLRGASQPGVFEHLPYWGEPINQTSLLDEWRNRMWPLPLLCLLPLLPLMLLACWLRKPDYDEELPELPPLQPQREPLGPDDNLPSGQLQPLWKPRGSLVIGLGNPGWQVLTQLKKTLANAELGDPSQNVGLLCILDGSQARHLERETDGLQLDDHEILAWQENLRGLTDVVNDDPTYKGWIDHQTMLEIRSSTDPKTGFQDRRVMGRMALIDNLRKPGDDNLWQRLQTAAQTVLEAERELAKTSKLHDPERLHVLLVTDLSDDVGSGAFLDVAYLVRQLQQSLGLVEVRLVGHLLTDRATQGRQRSDLSRATNTIAALRETERFQLAIGAAFPMAYTSDPAMPMVFDGDVDDSLFDDVYVYDGERQPASLSHIAPEKGIYPSLADGIALWLDTAANRGGLDQWRDTMRGVSTNVQLRERKLAVSSLGLYQFRLPFADLLEDITVRYARRVLQLLLMGNTQETPRYAPELAKEQFISGRQAPADLVQAFLGERFGTPQLSKEWRLIFNGVVSNDAETVRRAARKLSVREERDNEAWRQWLAQVVGVLLNGQHARTSEPIDPVLRRGAKIGLAKAFLDTLAAEGGPGSLKGIASQISQIMDDPEHPVVGQLQVFASIAGEVRDHLVSVGDALGMGAKQGSLHVSLAARYARITEMWNQQENLQTRSYITTTNEGEPLREVWYDTYMLKPDERDNLTPIEKGVRQLYWKVDESLKPALVLKLPSTGDDNDQEVEVTFDPADVATFEEKILFLGRYFAREIPEQEGLAKILNKGPLGEDEIATTLARLLQNSGVLLMSDERATALQPGIVLSAHQGIERIDDLKRRLRREKLNDDEEKLKVLDTTDRFTLTLIQTADALTIDAVNSLNIARDTYMDEMGLVRTVQRPGRSAVFEADATALSYERQLVKIKQSARMFNPIVVTGLANRIKAEAYLLAAVVNEELQETGQGWVFTMPEMSGNEVLIPKRDFEHLPNGVLMDGLLKFVGYWVDPSAGVWQPRISEDDARAIYDRYSNTKNRALLKTLDTWDRSEGEGWLAQYSKPELGNEQIIKDLIAITRILIKNIFG